MPVASVRVKTSFLVESNSTPTARIQQHRDRRLGARPGPGHHDTQCQVPVFPGGSVTFQVFIPNFNFRYLRFVTACNNLFESV